MAAVSSGGAWTLQQECAKGAVGTSPIRTGCEVSHSSQRLCALQTNTIQGV
eukprot:CAMPEP_0171106496 /NCGR_PEP_ID=MMETSP0766_2-20121228/64872_1 /TAXON_ID=439317 /ORGANISM="Gambierdiscus australes, Strain CAWD 149" /LENGTH=50 /DNA_ID=CAMNT_0011567591 /DNA_START=29 /DNA_END=181 /DNA_ORIENTATION=-